MRFLLDTHVWLWSLLEPARLSQRVSRALADEANELWVSPLSVWELFLLVEKGRVVLRIPAAEWVASAFQMLPAREAPLTLEAVLESSKVQLPDRDPVDRFLAGTARALELTLVTADARLIGAKGFSTLPNE